MSATSFRWEYQLSQSFQRYARPALWSRRTTGQWLLLCESTCSEGRADIVWGRFEPGSRLAKIRRHSALLQNPTASRLLAALKRRSAQSEEEILRRVGVSPPVLMKWLNRLLEAGLVVETQAHRYRAMSSCVFPPVEICSFELKLKDWKRALYQATRYRSFSHRAFVVMPSERAQEAFKNQVSFLKANVGLVSHDASGRSTVLIRPSKRTPNARFRIFMALGMLSERGVRRKQFSETLR